MKLEIERDKLLPALQIVNGVIERRQTLPILSNLLLVANDEKVTLTGTDMEVELITSVANDTKDTIEVTLPARKLLDICRALPEETMVCLEVNKDKVLLTSGKSRFTLSTLPAQEYPAVDVSDSVAQFQIKQKDFKSLLDKTAFAMAQQDVRYYLNGLLLELEHDCLRAVATDGHRLALCETTINYKPEQALQIIVPRKGITELIRLLEDDEKAIEIQISNNHIRIHLGELQFTSKLIDGKFPDYKRVVPEPSEYPVLANKNLLKQSLIRASILSNEKYRGVRIILEQDKLRAFAHNPEQEEAEEEIEVDYAGGELEIGFNVSYLLDALNIIKTERIQLTISDPNSSCLILPPDDEQCKFVVMPMRL